MRFLSILMLLGGVARAGGADDVVVKMQKYYDATKDLHARFTQTLETQMSGKKKASGEMWLKKPGKMRFDYAKPEKKQMISDGKTLWVYEPEDEQAFKQSMSSSTMPTQVSFLVGQGKLASEFDITPTSEAGVGGPGLVVLKLQPKAATNSYHHLLFIVDEKTGEVKEMLIYLQITGGTNHLVFSDVKQNGGVADGKFEFTPPAGTKIITP